MQQKLLNDSHSNADEICCSGEGEGEGDMERSDGDCSFSFSFSLPFSLNGIVIGEIDGIEFFLCFCFDDDKNSERERIQEETGMNEKLTASFVVSGERTSKEAEKEKTGGKR